MVPTRELLHQWTREPVCRILPEVPIGRLGDGGRDVPADAESMCWWGSVNSARASGFRLGAPLELSTSWTLCHRCGSEINRIALASEFESRLGAYARRTRAWTAPHETVIEPYFGGVVYRFGIRRRHRAGGRNRDFPRWSWWRSAFSEDLMRAQYEYLDEKRAQGNLISADLRRARLAMTTPEPFGEFMKAVNRLRLDGVEA